MPGGSLCLLQDNGPVCAQPALHFQSSGQRVPNWGYSTDSLLELVVELDPSGQRRECEGVQQFMIALARDQRI